MKTVAYLLLIALLFVAYSTQDSDCGFGGYDLSSLKSSSDYTAQGEGYTFYVNFCANANKVCYGSQGGAVASSPSECNVIGRSTTRKFSFVNSADPSLGIKMVYPDGDKTMDFKTRKEVIQRANFAITCLDSAEKPQVSYLTATQNTEGGQLFLDYQFKVQTKAACSTGGGFCNFINPFCSVSVLFLIPLSIISVIGYFGIGAIVCKFVLKKQKWEIIPNVHFWKAIPFLIKDGAVFIWQGIKALIEKIKTARGKYRQLK